MLTFLFFLIVILGVVFPKSKLIRYIQYVCIYVVFVFNSWSQDEFSYRRIYEGYYGVSHEPSFDYLCQICYENGVSFEAFRIVYVSIAVLLILRAFYAIFRNASNRAYSLIMLYPLLPLAELLRNLMAIAIVLNGASWYFSQKKETIKEKLIFMGVIFLGATFHYNVLCFLIMLLPNTLKPKKTTYLLIVIISIASISVCNVPLFRMLLTLLIASEKILRWFDPSMRIGQGIILVLAAHSISFILYDFIYREYCSKIKDIDELKRKLFKVYSLNVYSFFLLGLYTYNMEFFTRLYIVVILLNCFIIASVAQRIKTYNMFLLNVVHLVYHIALFLFLCRPFDEDGIMGMILYNNYLFP